MGAAILNPVADWLAGPNGFENQLSLGTYSTLTRTTPKTVFNSLTNVISDVASGVAAVRPWGCDKAGAAGSGIVIEEARTNYLKTSYFGVDTDVDGLADNWSAYGTIGTDGARAYSRAASPIYGTAQTMAATGGTGASTQAGTQADASDIGTFASGDPATLSAWYTDVAMSGCTVVQAIYARTSGAAYLGSTNNAIASGAAAKKVTTTYNSFPASASLAQVYVLPGSDFHEGDTYAFTIHAAQLEKGAFATSYIPTTTATATRNGDRFTVPNTGMSANEGTVVMVLADSAATTPTVWDWSDTTPTRRIRFVRSGATTRYAQLVYDATAIVADGPTAGATGFVWALSWSKTAGQAIFYNNGTAGTPATGVSVLQSPSTDIAIGWNSAYGGLSYCHNAAIHRVIHYDRALNANEIAMVQCYLNGPTTRSRIADYIAKPTGFVNQLGVKDTATLTRTTVKTVFNSVNGTITDVASGQPAVRPWACDRTGGRGYGIVIEEARTNYLLNTYGAANTGGLWDSWTLTDADTAGTPTQEIVSGGPYGTTAQRLAYTADPADTVGDVTWYQTSASGTFASGEAAVGTVYAKGTQSGLTHKLYVQALASGGVWKGNASVDVSMASGSYSRQTVAYSSLPADTSRCKLLLDHNAIAAGDSFDVSYCAAQLEKGAFATSYIPTTTATATRNGDLFTIPTTGWSYSAGTMVVVLSPPDTSSRYFLWVPGTSGNVNRINFSGTTLHAIGFFGADGTGATSTAASGGAGASVAAFTWDTAQVQAWHNAASGAAVATDAANGLAANAHVGSSNVSANTTLGGAIHRLIVFDYALSAAEITALNSLINGPPAPIAPKVVGVV